MNDERPSSFDAKIAEAGWTPEAGKATELILGVLSGFSVEVTQSILVNAWAVMLCNVCKTETEAIDSTNRLRREIERCIRKNYHSFKKHQEENKP